MARSTLNFILMMVFLISSLRKRNSKWLVAYDFKPCTYRWEIWEIAYRFRSCSSSVSPPGSWPQISRSFEESRKIDFLFCFEFWVNMELPSDVLLNHTPFGAHLIVNFIQLLKFLLLPVVVVEFWVQKVDPLFPALDFCAVIAFLSKNFSNMLPFLGHVERIEGSEQL